MRTRVYRWQVRTQAGERQVTLEISGSKRIIQAGQSPAVCHRKKHGRRNFYPFDLDGHEGEISVSEGLLSDRKVSLKLDDKWVPGEHEMRPDGLPEPESPFLSNCIFLERLAQHLGLRHIVIDPDGDLLDRVVVGFYNGFLCVIRVVQDSEGIPYHRIIVRYRELRENAALKKEVVKALRKIPFFKNTGIFYSPYVGEGMTTFGCYLSSGQEELQRYLETATGILKKYVQPVDPDQCEKGDCQSGQKADLILIGRFPLRWCADCIRDYHKELEVQRLAYQQSPSRFAEGVAASLVTLFAASPIVAVMMDRPAMALFSMLVPMLVFAGLLRFLDRSGIKLTRKLFPIPALSVAAIHPLGTYLALAKRIYQEPSLLGLEGILIHPWTYLGKIWGLGWMIAVWVLILAAIFQYRVWTAYRDRVKSEYSPQIFFAGAEEQTE